jgi:hypothetical protein
LIGKINKLNKAVIEYSDIISEKEFRNLFSNTLFPDTLTDDMIGSFGYACIDTISTEVLLQETTTMKLGCKGVLNTLTNTYDREWILVPVDSLDVQDRLLRKIQQITEKRNELLAQSDYTQTLDNFFMKTLWADYRQTLRDSLNQGLDPFLIVFPNKPDAITADLASQKIYFIEKVKEKFNKSSVNNIVDTGLGYTVNGNYEDYLNFDIAKSVGITEVSDSSGIIHVLNTGDIDTILNAVKMAGLVLIQNKRTKIAEINACATVADLALVVI